MTTKTLLSMFAVGALALAFAGAGIASAQPAQSSQPAKQEHKQDSKEKKHEKKDDKKVATAAIGSMAPDFELKDTDGKTHKLSDLTKAGKIVVLQWFNPDCPVVKMHYDNAKTFIELNKSYKDKNVVLLAINSGAAGKQGSGQERNAKAKKDWNIDYPILLDEAGTVGKAYGSKNTPTMYIINKDGILAYHGAIDDGAGDAPGKTNYVAKALDEIIAAKPVTTKETKAYGCAVKY